jgi:hypothetical protein
MSDERTRIACKAEFVDALNTAVLLRNLLSGEDKGLKRLPDIEKDGAAVVAFLRKTAPESDGSDVGDRAVAKLNEQLDICEARVEEYPTLPKLERGAHLHGGRKPKSAEERAASFLD